VRLEIQSKKLVKVSRTTPDMEPQLYTEQFRCSVLFHPRRSFEVELQSFSCR